MKNYDIIIIGAGIAGLTAAIYAARTGKTVLVLEGKAYGGQIIESLKIENWPGEYGVSGADLMKKIKDQAISLGAKLKLEKVESIKKVGSEFKVITEDDEYAAKNVVVAVGTEPRKLGEKQTKEAAGRPISYCATCDGSLYKDKPVVVVGSGNTAKYEIEYLKGIASKVYNIHHDEDLPGDAAAIFVATGHVPSTGFLQGIVDLDEKGYIVAGEDCKTSCPGIFAIGDCRTKSVRQLVTAAGDAAVAIAAIV